MAVQAGALFDFDQRPIPHLRLGFAREEPRELQEAVRRLARALPRRRRAGPRPPGAAAPPLSADLRAGHIGAITEEEP